MGRGLNVSAASDETEMAQAINGKFPVTFRLAFELRYNFGYTYLDRCGRVINTILREYPEWIQGSAQPSPQNTPLVSIDNSGTFSFSALKLDLGLQKPIGGDALTPDDLAKFTEQVEELTPIVVDQLSLKEFTRIGCRVWYLFPCDTEDEANQWLRDSNCFTISESLGSAFGGKPESASVAAVISAADRKFRIGFDMVERAVTMDMGESVLNISPRLLPTDKRIESDQRRNMIIQQQKVKKTLGANPPFAAMIDVDASQDEPEIIRAGEFVQSSLDLAEKGVRAAIRS